MRKNDLIDLTCDRLGADLEGVGRYEGMAVFVPGLLPGETAPVRIVKVQPRFAFGRMVGASAIPSPCRKTPDCAAYPRCGGCAGRRSRFEAHPPCRRQAARSCCGKRRDHPCPARAERRFPYDRCAGSNPRPAVAWPQAWPHMSCGAPCSRRIADRQGSQASCDQLMERQARSPYAQRQSAAGP